MASRYRLDFEFPDGTTSAVEAGEDEYILAAARRQGLELPSLCEQGWDLACAMRVVYGDFDQKDSRRYYGQDRAAGFCLPCTAKPRSNLSLLTHQTEAMREHRDRHGLPAPRGT